MSDETSWDTDEVERWIANTDWLLAYCHDLARMAYSEAKMAYLLRMTVDWHSLEHLDVDMDNVDWEYLAGELLEGNL